MAGVSASVLREMRSKADAAVHDERITRDRVALLEAWVKAFSEMSLLRRLKWLATGR